MIVYFLFSDNTDSDIYGIAVDHVDGMTWLKDDYDVVILDRHQ